MIGDPHITTLDGSRYTFNAIGDFDLLQGMSTRNLSVQARLTRVPGSSSATVFSAYAAQTDNSSLVEVLLKNESKMVVLVDRVQQFASDEFDSTGKEFGNVAILSNTNGSVVIVFSNGFVLAVSLGYKQLIGNVKLPSEYTFTLSLIAYLRSSGSTVTLTNQNVLTIHVIDTQPISIELIARDVMQASSAYQPEVRLCHCLNGGVCSFGHLESILRETNTNIDECLVNNGYCEDGCTNTFGSFRCDCTTKTGFSISPTNSSRCEDVDECAYEIYNCSGTHEVCNNVVGSYECNCKSGFTRNNLGVCSDIDECLNQNVCDNNAICSNNAGSFSCRCNSGYYGDGYSCQDINECDLPSLNQCQQLCVNTIGGHYCDCYPGYALKTGSNFECQDENECENLNPCSDLCINTIGSFQCACQDGFSLENDQKTCSNIDECLLSPCGLNALCTDLNGTYTCDCMSGFSGSGSCEDVDECNENPCGVNAACLNLPGIYTCLCDEGYYGNPDVSCSKADMIYAGELRLKQQFNADLLNRSSIAFHILSKKIEQRLNDVFSNQYQNFKSATINSFSEGSTIATFSLGFSSGANTPTYSQLQDTLSSSVNELPSGVCIIVGVGSAYCTGSAVSDFDECSNKKFHSCPQTTECRNTFGSFECYCASGYIQTGKSTTNSAVVIPVCTDVNECLTVCKSASTDCVNTAGGYTCTCKTGYVTNGAVNISASGCSVSEVSGDYSNRTLGILLGGLLGGTVVILLIVLIVLKLVVPSSERSVTQTPVRRFKPPSPTRGADDDQAETRLPWWKRVLTPITRPTNRIQVQPASEPGSSPMRATVTAEQDEAG
ncbi:uncharacterized protein LOC141910540 [Tubulanus polymorphus]|uniref:uncharacterized protein LOC141910540 n=1 Tax=Tubulanus polymorphus TaxID=672921 RepID=UPI003DA6548E